MEKETYDGCCPGFELCVAQRNVAVFIRINNTVLACTGRGLTVPALSQDGDFFGDSLVTQQVHGIL